MSLRIIFMGMGGEFSAIPLERLLGAGGDVCAVVVPSLDEKSSEPIRLIESPSVPTAEPLIKPQPMQRNVVALARAHDIRTFEVGDLREARAQAIFADLAPDLIVVACFPFILPRKILQLPTHGCFNLHPSLLPRLRGPAPLFWTFHEDAPAGVTLHRMSEQVDAGDIVAQTPLAFPAGIRYAQAERVCAQWGARLLVDAVRAVERGTLSVRPQSADDASYFPHPSRADLIVPPDWSARRAFNFMRGVMGFGTPIIQVDDKQFVVREALAYATGETMPQVLRRVGDQAWVQFADGVVQARVDSTTSIG